MDDRHWRDDDALLAALAEATRQAGEPTDTMAAAADAAYSWRTVDAELAALTYDSLADDAVLVRDAGTASRQLVFEGEGLAVELEHTPDGLVGQLVPPSRGTVMLLGPGGELATVQADALGLFHFGGPRRGPVRLRCVTGDHAVLTDWVQV
ncbi:hypothetical protein [Nocardioides sp. GXQ0305]|uniref:hypothetical protein n=1 Tax=Nocardioides sp. GXQ0305 TaxID=3423912 RepID=UPI003D7EAD25